MQTNHVHLMVEATSNKILSSGMRSLTVSFAKGVNRGRIQIRRYHLHVLRGLRETRNALRYVLLNEQKHTRSRRLKVNGYSSLQTLGYDFIKRFIKKEKLSMIWNPEERPPCEGPGCSLLKRATVLLI